MAALGITWFGYAISMHFLISPTLAQLPEDQGRITNSRLGEVGARVFPDPHALPVSRTHP
jgi:hypothetical protein